MSGNPVQPVVEALDGIIKNVEQSLSISTEKQCLTEPSASTAPAASEVTGQSEGVPVEKKKKEKKAKQPKQPSAPALPVEVTQFLQCDLRIGRVTKVEHHPEADGLFVLEVSYEDSPPRTVCAGLRNFLSDDDMRDRMVVTICNLKPRKLRGVNSEAMILAGSVVSTEGSKETVVPLAPPAQAREGDIVSVTNMPGERTVTEGKFVSAKTWDKVAARLSVSSENACYGGFPLVAADANVSCKLPDGAEIH